MDLSYHTTQDGRKLQILHMIDEASKFHTAKVIASRKVQNYSDLGNCTFKQLHDALQEWFRYVQHPQKIIPMGKAFLILMNSRNFVEKTY